MKTIIMNKESNKSNKGLMTIINGVLMPLTNALDFDKK